MGVPEVGGGGGRRGGGGGGGIPTTGCSETQALRPQAIEVQSRRAIVGRCAFVALISLPRDGDPDPITPDTVSR